MDAAEAKRVMRRSALRARARIDPAERARLSELLTERVLGLEEVSSARSVLAYASFGTEVPTDGLIERLLNAGVTVLLPAVDGEQFRAAPVASLAEVAPGYRGIREPVRRDRVEVAADVILVPGVAFDAAGNRLGFGGGFYDRYLADTTGLKVGICFEAQMVEAVPVEARDVPVSLVVTEARTIRAPRR